MPVFIWDGGTNDYWDAYISLYDTSAEVTLRWNGTQNPMESFLKWMEKQFSSACNLFKTLETGLSQLSSSAQTGPHLRQAIFEIDLPSGAGNLSTDSYSINSFALDFELDLTWGSTKLAFIMTFSWEQWSNGQQTLNTLFTLVGTMWPSPIEGEDMDAYKLKPDPPKPPPLTPIVSDYTKTVSLNSLSGMNQLGSMLASLPQEIPVELSGLTIELTSDQVSFSGIMIVKPAGDGGDSHSFPLVDINLNFVWRFGDSANLPPSCSFDAIAPLIANPAMKVTSNDDNDDDDESNPLPLCICSMQYDSPRWVLSATVEDLHGKILYSLLSNHGDADTVTKLLGEIYIPRLNITYIYDRAPGSITGDTFEADGLLRLGDNIDLALTFNLSNSKSSMWKFRAKFSYDPDGDKATIYLGHVVSSFSSDLQYLLPQFLSELELSVDEHSEIDLRCFKSNGDNPHTILGISAIFSGIEFSFV